MTIKEAIHAKVEQLDDLRASEVLDFIDGLLVADDDVETFEERTEDVPDALDSLIGILGPGEPSDIEKYKDDYIADAIVANWK